MCQIWKKEKNNVYNLAWILVTYVIEIKETNLTPVGFFL